jgi:hypothetical protein
VSLDVALHERRVFDAGAGGVLPGADQHVRGDIHAQNPTARRDP